jgi:hypothetical protein
MPNGAEELYRTTYEIQESTCTGKGIASYEARAKV